MSNLASLTIRAVARIRLHFAHIFLFLVAGLAFPVEPATAANYDGNVHFELHCRRSGNGTYDNYYNAMVLSGKFADRHEVKRGEEGCRNRRCWTAWEGSIKENGAFNIDVRENAWDKEIPDASYVGRWTITGKFNTEDSGTGKVVKFPNWLLKCQQTTITLVEPAPTSLAARSASESDSVDKAETEATEQPAQVSFKSTVRSANLLLQKVDDYAKSADSISNVIAVAEAASKLKNAVKALEARLHDERLSFDVEALSSQLAQLMAADGNFAKFAGAWEEKKKQADAQALIGTRSRANTLKDFLAQFVARNVTADVNGTFVPLIRELEQLKADTGYDELDAIVGRAETAIRSAGLDGDYQGFLSTAGGAETEAAEPAKSEPLPSPAATMQSQKRVALVIGNSNYQNATELPNPRNDAVAISAGLRELGFDVIDGQDLDKNGMEKSIRQFIGKVQGADVSLFFYAGHGMQVAGKNYLIPVDARLEDAAAVDFETVDADRVLGYMSDENRVAIAFLDACRDNPLARKFARSLGASRSAAVGRGLAIPATLGGGMLVGFATAPGDVALDGVGKNSPFTTALLKYLPEKGLEIQQLMTKVKAEVYEATNKQQSPWHNSDLRKEFYLKP